MLKRQKAVSLGALEPALDVTFDLLSSGASSRLSDTPV